MSSKVPKLRFDGFSGEWEEKKLKDITSAIFDGTHQTPKYTENGIPFFSIENIISRKKNKFISIDDYKDATKKNKPEKGDILITRIGNIGFSTIVTWDYNFSIYVTLAVIKKSDEFNSYYLHYYLQSPRYQSEILSKSLLNAVPCKINMDELRKTNILLPKNEKEQQKIANCLSSLGNLIESQSKKVKALEKHKKGLMQNLFPKDAEKEPNLRFDGFSGEWQNDELGKFVNITTGKLDANAMVENGKYRFYTCAKDYYYIDNYAFNTNALLISGNGANVGYIHHYNGKFNAYQRTYILDNFNIQILFMKYFLENNLYKRIEIEKKDGNTPYIVMSTLSEMIILLPTLPEQQKIANCLSSLDNIIENENEKIESLKKHKKGLMQQLFVNSEVLNG